MKITQGFKVYVWFCERVGGVIGYPFSIMDNVMKVLRVSILLLFMPFCLIGQNATVFHKENNIESIHKTIVLRFEKHLAVIFPAEYEPCFNVDYLSNRFTPDSVIINQVEQKIEEQYIKAHERYLKAEWKTLKQNKAYYDWEMLVRERGEREKALISSVSREKKKLEKYVRQYLGLINSKGERIVLVKLINLRKDEFDLEKSIDNEWIVGCGEWFEENTSSYEYVIDRDKLYLFGWTER
ncbi:hypothetical protein DMA11_16095 [Marinilabiliaceae bacterium JC017]|nr:hypothetical protein DMA11_16095 [Marinilabiliaceae bacterium JC017]